LTEEVVYQQPLPLAGWDELLGHEQQRAELLRMGRFASLLFSGPQGLGKRLVAAWLASQLIGDERRVLRNNHPDLVWLERMPGKQSLGVGEARELISQLYLRPYESASRVCIISEADRLTEEAQSALLKTLEEPPADNVLILVASQESKLLDTVQSRCRRVRFCPLPDQQLTTWLQQLGCPAEVALRYARLAQGCPGRARQLWETPALWESQEKLLDLLLQLPGSSLGKALELSSKAETLKIPGREARAQLEWVLEYVRLFCRDRLLLSHGARPLNDHRLEQMQALPKQNLIAALESLDEAEEFFQANVNARLLLQNLFLKLRR
jgi:DNA polymerase-3 subunit delta'